jgi:hypothetical protein
VFFTGFSDYQPPPPKLQYIRPGGYHAFVVPAGQVVCRVQTEAADQVEIHAQPRVYYIREEFGWGVLTGHPHLNPIDTDEAQSEIQSCGVLEPQQEAAPRP